MRWTDRAIGLVSTILLARLLVPDDFGVVAMASLVVGLVDVVLDLGVAAALIQRGHCDDDDYSSAWTIRLIQAGSAAILIAALASLAGEYFRDPRVVPVLLLMAATTMIGGLENIGIVTFQKSLSFGKDFKFVFFRRVVGFLATLLLAWYLRNYWAMPLGALIGRAFGVFLSYRMHAFRPRLTLSRFRHIWSVSQWMLVRNVGIYVDSRLDTLVVGRRFDAATVGGYTLADSVAAMPSTELLAPLGRVLFPAFVNVRDDAQTLKRVFLLSVSVQALVALPAATGLALVANEAVVLLLGERWLFVVPFIRLLALVYGATSIVHAAGYLLLTLGKVRLIAMLTWAKVGIFAVGLTVPWVVDTALHIAAWRLVVACVGALGTLVLLVRVVPSVALRDLLASTWRPMAATAVMAGALLAMPPIVQGALPQLVLLMLVGAALYALVLAALWRLAGRPDGGEAYLLAKLRGLQGRR